MEAKELIEQIKIIQKDVCYRKLKIGAGNNVDYDFSDYKTFNELFRDLYYWKITIADVEGMQDKSDVVLYHLNKYTPKYSKYIQAKNNLVKNVKKIYEGSKKNYWRV